MRILLFPFLFTACFEFKNDFAVDNDNDGLTEYDGDCDDNDANVGLAECTDDDGDGFAEFDGDCDDAQPLSFPGNPELCDTIDNNCDGTVDEPTALDAQTWYADVDGDGFGDSGDHASACEQPQNHVLNADDCDDLDETVHPDAIEECDGIDNDCDTLIDVPGALSSADYSFIGENPYDKAATEVSSAGDVDGDGLNDFLIGAPYNDDGGEDAGKVYLFLSANLGSSGNFDLSQADYVFIGENEGDAAGSVLSSAGDVDGDGLDDFLISSLDYGGNEDGRLGKIYLVLGGGLGSINTISLANADYAFTGEEIGGNAGGSLAGAGDVDRDGLDDFMIGASAFDDGVALNVGKTYLFLGTSLGTTVMLSLADADYSFVGEGEYHRAGIVGFAGDVDGDDLHDILIGASGFSDEYWMQGKTYLIFASSLGTTTNFDLADADYSFVGENRRDISGNEVVGAGDVDGDGLDDFLIGARNNDDGGNNAGKTYLIFASGLGLSSTIELVNADYAFIGENSADQSKPLGKVGDVDGDGLSDVFIGSSGQAYLILASSLGNSGELNLGFADFNFYGEASLHYAGETGCGVGDVNGDGLNDILVGAREYSGIDKTEAGKAYLILSGL